MPAPCCFPLGRKKSKRKSRRLKFQVKMPITSNVGGPRPESRTPGGADKHLCLPGPTCRQSLVKGKIPKQFSVDFRCFLGGNNKSKKTPGGAGKHRCLAGPTCGQSLVKGKTPKQFFCRFPLLFGGNKQIDKVKLQFGANFSILLIFTKYYWASKSTQWDFVKNCQSLR